MKLGDEATTIAKQLALEIYLMLRGDTATTATGFGPALKFSGLRGMPRGVRYYAHPHSPPTRSTAAADA